MLSRTALVFCGFSRAFARSAIVGLVFFATGGGGLAEDRTPDAGAIAAVDAALPKMALLLPSPISSDTDLIKLRREDLNIIYTIQFTSKAKVDQMRKASATNPHLFQNQMKKIACKPQSNKFLLDGFTIVWELVDAKELITRSALKLADCQ
jgi:hypothetical protein